MNKPDEQFNKLLTIIESLRADDGCPWDKKQTTESLSTYLIEEAHELNEALDSNDHEHIKEELGDMFFVLAFLGHMFKEKELFTVGDSIKAINDKMIRRHPHVFDRNIDLTEEEQRQSWLNIKKNEKKNQQDDTNIFAAIPRALPALRRAQKVSAKARQAELPDSSPEVINSSLQSALAQTLQQLDTSSGDIGEEEAGSLLYLIANLCSQNRINPEEALSKHIKKEVNNYLNPT